MMCGHVGIINREKIRLHSEKLIKFFYQGLYCDAVRGQHGTGILAVEGNGTQKMFKRSLTSSDFLELSTTKKIISDNDNVFLMGHNRHATYGQHTDDNTHPFVNDNITLFHNGTLSDHSKLNPGKTFGVDSDAVSYLLANSDDILTDLGRIKGAYAFVWYDDIDESINFARNSERTFYFGLIKDSDSLLYASESGMIEWLAARNNIVLEKVTHLGPGELVSIYLDSERKTTISHFTPHVAANTWRNYTTTSYEYPKKAPSSMSMEGVSINEILLVEPIEWVSYNTGPQQSPNQRYGYIQCRYKNDIYFNMSGVPESEKGKYLGKNWTLRVVSITEAKLGYGILTKELSDDEFIQEKLKLMPKSEVIITEPKNAEAEIIALEKTKTEEVKKIGFTPLTKDEVEVDDYFDDDDSYVKGPSGRFISVAEFRKKVQGGCVNCSDNLVPADAHIVSWDLDNNPYCPDCAAFYNVN
jgi:hypothetical protein